MYSEVEYSFCERALGDTIQAERANISNLRSQERKLVMNLRAIQGAKEVNSVEEDRLKRYMGEFCSIQIEEMPTLSASNREMHRMVVGHMRGMIRTPLKDEYLYDAEKQGLRIVLSRDMIKSLGNILYASYDLCATSQKQFDQTYQSFKSQERLFGEQETIEDKIVEVQELIRKSADREKDAVEAHKALGEEFVQQRKTEKVEQQKPVFANSVIKGREIMPEARVREILTVIHQARVRIKNILDSKINLKK